MLGIAPHSLRATAPDELKAIVEDSCDGPIHIHIAEQPKEVDEIQAWLGARPVEWLLANAPVDENWCLIHATHMTPKETSDFAHSRAVAGLCPITEANLGDGPFNGPNFIQNDGAFGVGSDSNVRISLSEELRSLEYSQRLRDFSRNVMVNGEGSVGELLYLGAAAGGSQALGRNAGRIKVGTLADLTAYNSDHQYLCALSEHQLLDGICFASDDKAVTNVWSAGRHVVQGGLHVGREKIIHNFKCAMKDLRKLLSA